MSENVVYVLSTHEIDDFTLPQTENVALGYPSKTKTIPFDSTPEGFTYSLLMLVVKLCFTEETWFVIILTCKAKKERNRRKDMARINTYQARKLPHACSIVLTSSDQYETSVFES